jgi:hypothetical protein
MKPPPIKIQLNGSRNTGTRMWSTREVAITFTSMIPLYVDPDSMLGTLVLGKTSLVRGSESR